VEKSMAAENEYSNKDSNHNRMLEERQSNLYISILLIFLAIAAGAGIYYYSEILRYHHVVLRVSPESMYPTPAPHSSKDPDHAKPYDETKPPDAQ
jgi:hypothetical protein